MGDLIQFVPRSTIKSDRAFWVGAGKDEQTVFLGDLDHIAGTIIAGALADNFIVPGVLADTEPTKDPA